MEAAYLGDLVMTTPLMGAALRDKWEVHVAIRRSSVGVLEGLIPQEQIHILPSHFLSAQKKLQSIRPQLTIVTHRAHSSVLAALGVSPRWGYGGGRSLLLSGTVRFDPMAHRVENHINLGRAAGLALPMDEPLVLRTTAGDSPSLPEGALVLNPNASWPEKAWTTPRWVRLAKALGERLSVRPVVVGGPNDRERCSAIANGCGGIDLGGKTDLPMLKRVLERARLLISHDSGPAHIAAALGTQVISVFGATHPELVGPWPPRTGFVLSSPRAKSPPPPKGKRERWIDGVHWKHVVALASELWV